MGKQKKGRRHRSVNRTPRPIGGALPPAAGEDHSCLSHQSVGRYRDRVDFVDGRAYPATARLHVDGKPMRFDLVANMHGVVQGEVTGECADILASLAFAYLEREQPELLPTLGEKASSPAELTEGFRRLISSGICGRDDRGGYIDFARVHAAHA